MKQMGFVGKGNETIKMATKKDFELIYNKLEVSRTGLKTKKQDTVDHDGDIMDRSFFT